VILRDSLKKLITGLTIPQEYVCVDLETLQPKLLVLPEVNDQQFSLDVTTFHLFLGYKPLIIGLTFSVDDPNFEIVKKQSKITLRFLNQQNSLARLSLLKIDERKLGNEVVVFFEGKQGVHSFLNPIHQWVNRQRERWRKQLPNNINLPGNLFEQVRIAYSVPRVISIVTVSDGPLMNMFPTDLHGPVGEKFYAGSLRRDGLANEQVEKYERIVISDVDVSFYKQAYSLGKNHMKELTEENRFLLHPEKSKAFNFPLPKDVICYRELKRIDFLDHGIHRIHLYEVIHEQTLAQGKSTLAHIHQYYAQWRLDQGIQTQMFLR
jgi:flavin reductase (DIM6/NTAB) family NADH-FMN oxidoreductase RutF